MVRLQKQTGIELHKGVFPKPIDHAVSEIRKTLDLLDQEFQGGNYRLATQAIHEAMSGRSLSKDPQQGFQSEELLAKLFLLIKPDLFDQSERNLDFLEGKVPREFDPSAKRFAGSSAGGRGKGSSSFGSSRRGGRGEERGEWGGGGSRRPRTRSFSARSSDSTARSASGTPSGQGKQGARNKSRDSFSGGGGSRGRAYQSQ